MGTDAMRCPKCEGAMVQGFLVDRSQYANLIASWVQGAPETSFWSGLKVPASIPVGTYRCSACGFLESYARADFSTRYSDPV